MADRYQTREELQAEIDWFGATGVLTPDDLYRLQFEMETLPIDEVFPDLFLEQSPIYPKNTVVIIPDGEPAKIVKRFPLPRISLGFKQQIFDRKEAYE